MIKLGGGASGLVVDSGLVELEGVVRGIDGHRDRADGGGGGLEVLLASGLDVLEAGNVSGLVVNGVTALKGALGLVGIAGLAVDSVVLDHVLEGSRHETTLATVVSAVPGTVEKVLLGETDESVVVQEPLTLHGTGGGERPAASALSLVLDGSDSALESPIDRSRGSVVGGLFEKVIGGDFSGHAETVHLSSELLGGKIGELVQTELEGVGFSVVFSDRSEIVSEDGVTSIFFLGRGVGLSMGDLPLAENPSKRVPRGSSNSQSHEGQKNHDKQSLRVHSFQPKQTNKKKK